MLLSYNFSDNLAQYKVYYASSIDIRFKKIYQILVYNLVNILTGKTNFGLIFNPNPDYLNILINTGSHNLEFRIDQKEIMVKNHSTIYYFNYDYLIDNASIELTKAIFYEENSKITEKYEPHLITIKVKTPSKTLELILPYDTSYLINKNLFKNLNSTTTLKDLINLYLYLFASNQSEYNFKMLETKIAIYDYNNKEQVYLKEGIPTYGLYEKETLNGKITITKSLNQNYEVKITGLNANFTIDLNELIKEGITVLDNILGSNPKTLKF